MDAPRKELSTGVVEILRCWVEDRERVCIVRAQGEVDLGTVHEFAEVLGHAAEIHSSVIIDLTETQYLDGQGLRVIQEVQRRCKTRGGFVAMVGASRISMRLFEIVGLHRDLVFFESAEKAERYAARLDRRSGSGPGESICRFDAFCEPRV